ncbi:PEFG-CTERM sorting domain-containing protein [Marine Group I thaumarchaeote]|uniref:PEFG-CTERM sorting domain-containing protein n=1 Tax=Marine Group I thaumarchaeote TaxID=2511932 RepID=A0A7K4P361_9ARCH|nr:MAG: PEFG-CTERM sorting domain-containing protein [Nitrosopumilus sp. YT1]NMI81769.1 PEFG-CTERM sorting domain-containing protein [Candidatus Nitrosopumilus sp. MTA1]NWJ19707.1 PEFG-CTERM sorting domain-containing protein [Marine Group I thaumarchaeote]NWJ56725.1 PEFG-CTERM sorting domain-containing protein [Marine Group I thaumarchaeote]NWJ83476.1 PEFG-CTERM sorting domain-containing protein [Marine Group I thaumarchaeote]
MNFKRSTTTMVIAIMALSLISMTSVQQDVFASGPGMSITATADQGSNTIAVTGMTALASNDVTFVVKSPSGNNLVTIAQVTPDDDGNFTVIFKVGQTWNEDGLYSITATQGQSSIYTLTVFVEVTSGMTEETSVTQSTLEMESILSIQTNVDKYTGLEISADAVEGSTTIEITGSTDRISEGITLTVTSPNGNIVSIAQVSPDVNGEFTTVFTTGGPLWKQDGNYIISAHQNDDEMYNVSVTVEIIDGVVIPEFGTIAAMILAVAIISIIAISAKSRLSIIPRY